MKTESSIQTSRFLATTCRANAALPRLRPTCWGPWQRSIPKPCFAVPVNDIDGCYQYPDVVRFEIEEQDLVLTGAPPIS